MPFGFSYHVRMSDVLSRAFVLMALCSFEN